MNTTTIRAEIFAIDRRSWEIFQIKQVVGANVHMSRYDLSLCKCSRGKPRVIKISELATNFYAIEKNEFANKPNLSIKEIQRRIEVQRNKPNAI